MNLTLDQLDNIKAGYMRAFLNAEGRKEIWKYDIVPRGYALPRAAADFNYDALMAGMAAPRDCYCLIGDIEDSYFSTLPEFFALLHWLVFKHLGEEYLAGDFYSNARDNSDRRQTEETKKYGDD